VSTHTEDVFARRLREARDAAGLTQQQLADALGIQRSSVARIETPKNAKGHRPVTLAEAVTLAQLLGVSLPDLLTDEPEPDELNDALAEWRRWSMLHEEEMRNLTTARAVTGVAEGRVAEIRKMLRESASRVEQLRGKK
jgi:transcriptional regulator with XRE-family HTH domain